MRSYWQATGSGSAVIATIFAVAMVRWPLAPVSIPTHCNGEVSIDRYSGKFQGWLRVVLSAAFAWRLITTLAPFQRGNSDPARIRFGYAILLIFTGVFGDLVLWSNGVVLNMNYILLPVLRPMGAAPGNLPLRAVHDGRGTGLRG